LGGQSPLLRGGISLKIDANGLLEWSKIYANKDTMLLDFQTVLQTNDGGYFYVGSALNDVGAQKPLTPLSTLINMIRTDVNGATLWSKGLIFKGPVDNEAYYGQHSSGMISDSNAFVSFTVQDTSNGANTTSLAMSSVNVFTGITNWSKMYSLPGGEQLSLRKAIADNEGNIIVNANDINNNTGIVFMFDEFGSLIRNKRFSTSNSGNFVNNTITTLDGGFMHMNEVDMKKVLLVKTDGDLNPSCPEVDSVYAFMLSETVLIDTSYFGISDTIVDIPNISAIPFGFGLAFSMQNDDSVICVCSNTLTGTVYDNSTPAENAKVFLFKKGMVPLPWQPYDTTRTDAAGNYAFYDFPTDSFIVRVEPNPALQPNAVTSYFKQVGFCFKWDSAGVFHVHCDSGVVVNDIDLINITLMTGNSSLSGYVFENTGGFSKGSFIPGDPIPGMDITVEQSPGGIVGTATTNGSGFYDLPNLDNSATYVISMDLPGLPMDSVYTMIVNLTDTLFDSLNFYVDTTGIFILNDSSPVGINVISFNDLKVDIYPNPSSADFNIVIVATKPEEIEYELINEYGQSVVNEITAINSGDNTISIDAKGLSQGIYFLKIKQSNKIYIKKLIKM